MLSNYHGSLLAFHDFFAVCFHCFRSSFVSRPSMPGLSVESLIRGSVSKPDRRDQVTSSRPSYSNSPYSNGARQSSYGDDKLSREKQWVQNSNSIEPTEPETNSPPPAYSETAKASLPTTLRPTPRPRSISRSPQAPPLQAVNTSPRLKFPIIIPQNPREGGFCRAYAPLLEECSVNEAAFFYFLDDFDRSAQASPWFSAVNISSIGSLNRPHSTAMIVALARKRYFTLTPLIPSTHHLHSIQKSHTNTILSTQNQHLPRSR